LAGLLGKLAIYAFDQRPFQFWPGVRPDIDIVIRLFHVAGPNLRADTLAL
jgi:hypothetical protein